MNAIVVTWLSGMLGILLAAINALICWAICKAATRGALKHIAEERTRLDEREADLDEWSDSLDCRADELATEREALADARARIREREVAAAAEAVELISLRAEIRREQAALDEARKPVSAPPVDAAQYLNPPAPSGDEPTPIAASLRVPEPPRWNDDSTMLSCIGQATGEGYFVAEPAALTAADAHHQVVASITATAVVPDEPAEGQAEDEQGPATTVDEPAKVETVEVVPDDATAALDSVDERYYQIVAQIEEITGHEPEGPPVPAEQPKPKPVAQPAVKPAVRLSDEQVRDLVAGGPRHKLIADQPWLTRGGKRKDSRKAGRVGTDVR